MAQWRNRRGQEAECPLPPKLLLTDQEKRDKEKGENGSEKKENRKMEGGKLKMKGGKVKKNEERTFFSEVINGWYSFWYQWKEDVHSYEFRVI